jgi:hypothetical protein
MSEFERGFKARANRIALETRARMGLAAIDPIDPLAICLNLDVEVIPMSSLRCDSGAFADAHQGAFSAMTVSCGIRTAIVHNDSHHHLRQRSNICHELAHLFLGHRHMPPLTEEGERAHDSGIEAEANFLGGCLLMPNEAALHVVSNSLTSRAQLIYGVSKPMLDYRLRISGAHVIHKRRYGLG